MPARDLNKMRRELDSVAKEMRALIDVAEQRDTKALTSEEETKFTELREKAERIEKDIKREKELQDLEAGTGKKPEDSTPDEIRSFGEFLQEVRFNPSSNYLQQREVGGKKKEGRDMTFGNGPSAGFMVPEQFDRTIRTFQNEGEAIFRPRSLVIPAGDPPDSAFNLMALDQSGALGVYSGVVVRWIAEQGARQDAGDPRLRGIKIEPQEVSGFIDVSDKLLRNAMAAGTLVETLLRGAIKGSEEDAFYTGDGVGKPLGIIGHPSTITIARGTANSVTYVDIVNMYSRVKFGGSLVWIASQSILPRLMTMVDAANQLVWQPNAREGAPGQLLGIPVVMNDQSPVLGSEGDLSLVDLKYYAIKDGSPLAIFIDPYTQKLNGTTRIYAFWNVDGQPMLTSPMLQRDGVSTVSPFVVLQ